MSGYTFDLITGQIVAYPILEDEADELNQDELYNAQIAFYNAYTSGSHNDWLNASEALVKAIERRYNLAEVRCEHCGQPECSH